MKRKSTIVFYKNTLKTNYNLIRNQGKLDNIKLKPLNLLYTTKNVKPISLFLKNSLDNKNLSFYTDIKLSRVKFKPGYQRI